MDVLRFESCILPFRFRAACAAAEGGIASHVQHGSGAQSSIQSNGYNRPATPPLPARSAPEATDRRVRIHTRRESNTYSVATQHKTRRELRLMIDFAFST